MRDDRQRLDKWLWFARFARTRSVAVSLVEDGHVRIAGRRIAQAAYGLKLGDVLTLALPRTTLVVSVRDLGSRRGPYEEARLLYEVVSGDERGDPRLAGDEHEP